MFLTHVIINNYKSFPPEDTTIYFHTQKTVIIGRNNSGKSNLLSVIEFLLGNKDPRYVGISKENYFDTTKPLRISAFLAFQNRSEIYKLGLAKKYEAILYKELKNGASAFIEIQYSDTQVEQEDGVATDGTEENEAEAVEKRDSKFKILIQGKYPLYQKIKEIRTNLCKVVGVNSLRNPKEDLSGSKWNVFGQLMKTVLEDSERYEELKKALNCLNLLVEEILAEKKDEILKNAKLISFINDIKFQLTKDNQPAELLRNLELFVKDKDKFIHIDETGTGTQSALIIGILEVALKYKSASTRIFLIEEPELFLHPLGIRHLGLLFEEFASDKLSQIIITSHSPILLSIFHPIEIIRLDKPNEFTEAYQLPQDFADDDNKLARQMANGSSSEMFFADKVLIVEGETEYILFPKLSFNVPDSNFYKNNIAVVNANGKGSIISIIKTLELLKIKWKVITDNDFLNMKQTTSPICKHLRLNPDAPKEEMRAEFLKKGIWVLQEGETENLIPDEDLVKMTGKDLATIKKLKAIRPKLSETFEKEIFGKSKPEIAFEIVSYYWKIKSSPFDHLIKWVLE
ncbi:MAG: AAA family ATPase [Cyclobacteriaceae bacterium]|nr:AAA family ATPase [Cyclobacteriaceae bacterium]